MPMRHPLRDLPLDSFLPREHGTSSKRPLSPSAALLGPSKRRILSAEGLYSPEKRRNSTPARLLLSEFVASPSSPARRLDFAMLSHPMPRKVDVKPARDVSPLRTPVQRAGNSPKLAPSPEIASSSTSGTSSALCPSDPSSGSPGSSDPSLLVFIPREMPTFSDRQSIHWPGFDVHADTHIAIPISQSTDPTLDASGNHNEDDEKENTRPRRRGVKRLTLEEGNPVKPGRHCRAEKQESREIKITPMLIPPGKRMLDPREREQERRHNMLIMVRELDQESNEEEDVEHQL